MTVPNLNTRVDDGELEPNEVLVRAFVLDVLPDTMWPSTRHSIEVAPRCFKCHAGISFYSKTRIKFLVTYTGDIPTHAVKLCADCATSTLKEGAN